MLALSLLYQSKFQDALVSAQEAARLDPQNAHITLVKQTQS
jgi:cytochrome c-type biogenesis protein CcmH/NrfG